MPTNVTPQFRKTAESFTSGAMTLPQRYFVSRELFSEEQERIFSRGWLCVGHQGEISRRGDYILRGINGESFIVLREQNSRLHAFYNVCRHRSTRMCQEKIGQLRLTIQCPDHTRCYYLDC